MEMAYVAKAGTALAPFHDEYGDPVWVPPPCQEGCPVGTDIPSYLALAWEGKYREAFEVIQSTNPFSSVCGRVCAKPCETACRRSDNDAAVAIREVKRFVTDRAGKDFRLPVAEVTRAQSVCIVGGGPAGLTAAQDLAEAGYEVHLYERRAQLGGMAAGGIPPFRLPRALLQQDIDRILQHCPGITVHLNCAVGEDVTLGELKSRHNAVLLTIGLWRDRKLGVPGEDEGLRGLHGIDFLTGISDGQAVTLNGKAVVIGGGNVAMDTARSALRSGASEVQLFCLESRHEMPAWKHEIEEAEAEGVLLNPGWGPKRILQEDGRVVGVELMQCVSVFDDTGRFNPSYDTQQTRTVACDSLLVSIGQAAENPGLTEGSELWAGSYVRADFRTMRTADPKVFAAGDGAFGPSAIVHAMAHGHRAAYYIQAHLEGREDPAPYQLSCRSRQLPVAQDPLWEKLPRKRACLQDSGSSSDLLSECQATFDEETAREQAARCFRCDAETGTANYSRRTRDHIHAMARTSPDDKDALTRLLRARLRPRDNPYPEDRPAKLDDVVFLAAAMTRLIIDPYREACALNTPLGKGVELRAPLLFTGFDDAPEVVRHALGRAIAATGSGYLGRKRLPDCGDSPWLQLLGDVDASQPQSEAHGLVYLSAEALEEAKAGSGRSGQLLGMVATSATLPEAIPFALENGLDLLVLDGTTGIDRPWPEANGVFDLTVIRDAIRLLRERNKEESIALLYFGGLRTGTDVAKVLAMNCNAGVLSLAAGLALGGQLCEGKFDFQGSYSFDGINEPQQCVDELEERAASVENWVKATIQEVAIIPRCLGKTNVHNMEPEDIRAITIKTQEAMGIPLPSGRCARTYY